MSEIREPEFSPNIQHAIMAHVGEEDWHDKSLRRVMFSSICSDTEHFLPANDTSTAATDDFVARIKEAFKEYGTFPVYNIGNLWVSFRVYPKMKGRNRRIRVYFGGAHYHVYRILVPKDEAIRAVQDFIAKYEDFEKEWWKEYDKFVIESEKNDKSPKGRTRFVRGFDYLCAMNVFNKYIWLVNTLRRYRSGASLEDLRRDWYDSDLNADHSELNARTFFRWKEGVMDQFGIIIECDAANGYKYYIENDSRLEQDRTTAWMLHTVTVSNIIEEFKGSKDKILLEDVPSGEEFLVPILNAIKSCHQLLLIYKPFDKETALPKAAVCPLCVRLFNRRWYVVVDYVEPQKRRVLALDRIVDLQPTKQKFAYPKDFCAKDYFAFDYGIAVGFEENPCKIRLKVNAFQRPYTRALPLHLSQKEVETKEDYSVFEYFLRPSNDFARAILPFGQNYEVLEPKELREKVRDMAQAILNNNQ